MSDVYQSMDTGISLVHVIGQQIHTFTNKGFWNGLS